MKEPGCGRLGGGEKERENFLGREREREKK